MSEAQDDRKREAEIREALRVEDSIKGSRLITWREDCIPALLRLLDAERKRAETAEARCAVLEAALRRFGMHTEACDGNADPGIEPCSCGLDAALAASPAPSGGEGKPS